MPGNNKSNNSPHPGLGSTRRHHVALVGQGFADVSVDRFVIFGTAKVSIGGSIGIALLSRECSQLFVLCEGLNVYNTRYIFPSPILILKTDNVFFSLLG